VGSVSDFNDAITHMENKRALFLVRQVNGTRFYSIKME
jgi:hypothetical protein